MSQTQSIALIIAAGNTSLTAVEQDNGTTVYQNLAATPGVQESLTLKVRRAKNGNNQRVETMYAKPYEVVNAAGNTVVKYASVASVTSLPADCPAAIRQELLDVQAQTAVETQISESTLLGAGPL